MGIYRNQAQRVFDHLNENGGLELLNKSFNITVERIEEKIEESVKRSGLNGKKCADALIKFWDAQKKTIDESTE